MRRLSLKNLLEKLDLSLRQRIPVIHQTESSECGLASLAMISAHYGKSIDLISLRQQFNLSARGATLAGLTGMAAELGMTTRALSLDMDDLPNLRLPCILHWDFNHFLVLVKISGNKFILHDPAYGRRYGRDVAQLYRCGTGSLARQHLHQAGGGEKTQPA